MDSLFRVFLNGQFLDNEPLGLPDTELTISRDEELKGVFLNFTSELTFWGDGYDVLKVIRDTQASCSQVPCNIEYRCAETGGWEVLFEGIIPLGSDEVEWDDYNCKVSTRVENADFSNFLKQYGDYRVNVNPGVCIDNSTALTDVTTLETDYFNSFAGAFNVTGVKTYGFIPLLQHILSYLSNNTITLNADALYSTLYLRQELEIIFNDPWSVGETVTVDFTNYFGQEYSCEFLGTGNLSLDYPELEIRFSHIIDPTVSPASVARTNAFEKANNSDRGNQAIYNYLPWSSYSITNSNPLKTHTIIENQPFVYGLKNLAVTSSTLIQEQAGSLNFSLNDLLIHAAQMHNMGFQIVNNGSGYDFNLTYLPDLLDNTDTNINLPQVPAIKSKASGAYNAQTITSAKGKADNVFKPLSWNTANCYGDQISIKGQNFSTQDFFDILNATQVQDDELYFVFLDDVDNTLAAQYAFRNATPSGPGKGVSQEFFHYNIPYIMGHIIKQNQISAADNNLLSQIPQSTQDAILGGVTCTQCPAAFIDNDNDKILRYLVTFDYPMTYTQVRTLIDNSLQYITYSDGKRIIKNAFIKEVTIPFKSFICSFECYID